MVVARFMSLISASCSPDASQQSIGAALGWWADGVCHGHPWGKTVDVGIPWVGITWSARFMSRIRASCSPDASQQSIWASLGGWAEGCITAIRGVNSSCRCRYSLGKDQKVGAPLVSYKSLMFSRC
jgi:hypothetical protein